VKVIGYLDPGTGTLIVQAVLGGAAGAAMLFKTKGKKLFKRNGETEVTEEVATGETAEDPAVPSSSVD
jgi:hypothetical protein